MSCRASWLSLTSLKAKFATAEKTRELGAAPRSRPIGDCESLASSTRVERSTGGLCRAKASTSSFSQGPKAVCAGQPRRAVRRAKKRPSTARSNSISCAVAERRNAHINIIRPSATQSQPFCCYGARLELVTGTVNPSADRRHVQINRAKVEATYPDGRRRETRVRRRIGGDVASSLNRRPPCSQGADRLD